MQLDLGRTLRRTDRDHANGVVRSRIVAMAIVVLSLLMAPAALGQGVAEPSGPDGRGISINDDIATDAAIERRIQTILRQIDDLSGVRVSVNAGVVELSGQVLESSDIEELEALVSRVEGVVTIENAVVETTDLSDRLVPALDRFSARIGQIVAYLPLLLVALAVFLVIVAIGFLLTRSRRSFGRLAPNAFIADIYRQIFRIAFVLAGIVVALDILGATALIGTILGAAGIVGLAIGFAVRDTVENFVASIMLSVRQPFRPNDFVQIEGDQGNVVRLTSRATILLSVDGNHVRIPNATVFKSRIINFTRNPERRFEFDLGVDAEDDLAAAQAVCFKALTELDFVLVDPAPKIWVEAVGDSNVIIRLSGWVDQRNTDFLTARGEAIRMTKAVLEREGFGLPEPIYRLRFDSPGALTEAPPTAQPTHKPKPPTDLRAGTVEKDSTIEEKVTAERQSETAEDLLSTSAAEE